MPGKDYPKLPVLLAFLLDMMRIVVESGEVVFLTIAYFA